MTQKNFAGLGDIGEGGMAVRYPVVFHWTDGSEVVIKNDYDHLAKMAVCQHEELWFTTTGYPQPVYGCWKCLSVEVKAHAQQA